MTSVEPALSLRNPNVQHLRRLIGRRRSRTEAGQFVFEGPTLVEEALRTEFPIDAVFVDAIAAERLAPLLDRLADATAVHLLADGVLAKVSDTNSPQAIVAVAPRPKATLESFLATGARGLVILLDAVSDPGNAGTVVRTAEAVGAAGVVFASDSTDPYGPKTVRAAAGSAFRVPLAGAGATPDAMATLRSAGFSCVGAVATDGDDHRVADLTGDVGLVLGSEAHGLAPDVVAVLDRRVTIPMRGAVESLNVAAAAAVLGYERIRQSDAPIDVTGSEG
jgi:TrmH family RNA methyltransferase